ncbi:MAG: hypothetical protein AB1391_00385 [Candidatus Micrarchaeota archaeon]
MKLIFIFLGILLFTCVFAKNTENTDSETYLDLNGSADRVTGSNTDIATTDAHTIKNANGSAFWNRSADNVISDSNTRNKITRGVIAYKPNTIKPNTMELRSRIIECRTTTVTSILDYANQNNLTGGISDTNSIMNAVSRLTADTTSLKTVASAKNKNEFKNTIMSTRSGLTHATQTIRAIARPTRNSITGRIEENTNFKTFIGTAKDTQTRCIRTVALNFSRAQIDEITSHLENMNNTIKVLRNKSVDTSKLDIMVKEAENAKNELSTAVGSENISDITRTIKTTREKHLHIWARFHITKIEAVVDSLSSEANSKGYSSMLGEIKSLLMDASGKIEVGRAYQSGEFEIVKNDIKQAQEKLKELIKKLRSTEK